ncbi:MAG: ABC transporter substrate-binding protein [Bacteroidaceae bacterium]|nr:ABC transporter substrate-binding protein [Bacteroidaceae bacterium]
MKKILFLCLLCLLAASCRQPSEKGRVVGEGEVEDSALWMQPRYAKGFTVKYLSDGVRLVEVTDPQQDDDHMPIGYSFALVPRGCEVEVPEGYERVEVPIRSTITMTSLQLSNFTALDAHDYVKGITGTKNLYNENILQRVRDGRIQKIGMEGNFDPELILAARPDVIFISPFKRGGYDAIKETGITLIPHLGYKELTPLGQAEWVKFVAMFLGKEREANEVFDGIERRYNDLKQRVDSLTAQRPNAPTAKRPTVFSGEMHGGNWYAVGGRNHLAQMFRDAGADYIIKDDNTGGVNLEYEQLYATAANADYWRILNSFPGDFSYEALLASEPRNALFKAFKDRHVIYCNMRQTPYYELAPVQPDRLLADLVAIFHPELLPDHEGTFYRLLK